MANNFAEFYKNTYSYAYVFFSTRIFDKSSVDDLCQETYLRFYKKFGDKVDEKSIKVIFGFCKNIYKEFVYKNLKEKQVAFNDEIQYENLLNEKVTEDPIRLEQLKLITQALPKLNPKVRNVIEYRFIYSMSRKEVGGLLGMKERDVLKYQQRGITYIKRHINGPGSI